MQAKNSRIFILIAILLLAVGAAKANAEKTQFEGGTMVWAANLAPGEVSCPGGEVTGSPYGPFSPPPCTPGSRFHIRNRVMQFNVATTDTRANGLLTQVVNWNWDTTYSGRMWGTFKMDVGDGVFWEGTWTGVWDSSEKKAVISFEGHGSGGDIEGQQLKLEYEGGLGAGIVAGRILDPKGAK